MSTWACIYTRQKTKRAKAWQDGILKVSINDKKATLCDAEGKVLDSKFLGRGFVVERDAEMEMDRFLVLVRELIPLPQVLPPTPLSEDQLLSTK